MTLPTVAAQLVQRAYRRGALAAMLLLACDAGRPAVPRLDEPLTAAATAPAATIPLAPLPLAVQADFDRLEASWRDRRSMADLDAVYAALAEGADPAARPADALLLMRRGALVARLQAIPDWVGLSTRVADRLVAVAPDSPHTLYLQGYLARLTLASSANPRRMIVTRVTLTAAERVLTRWARLLALAPGYDGPGDHDAAAIRADLAELGAAVTAYRAHVASGATTAVAVAAHEAAPSELAALADVAAFEAGGAVVRRVMCQDRVDSGRVGGASAPEARADLLCALADGHTRDAVAALARLVATGADGCPLASRLRAALTASSDASDAADRLADLARLGLDRCDD